MFRSSLILASALLLVAGACAHASYVQYSQCSDNNCGGSCGAQTFPSGQCLQVQGTNQSVMVSCGKTPNFCMRAITYSDAKCTRRVSTDDTVCNSCQNGFTIACGALFDATFWVRNCTDNMCANCNGPVIVPYKKCKQLAPGVFGIVNAPQSCNIVNFNLYTAASDCTGNMAPAQYWSGHCNKGLILTCSNSSTPLSPQVAAVRTIKLDTSRIVLV